MLILLVLLVLSINYKKKKKKRLQMGIFGFSQKETGAESVAMATI